MASRGGIRNKDWEEDFALRDDLKLYVQRNFRQAEVLDLVTLKYPMYAWSLRTLSRRLGKADRLGPPPPLQFCFV